MKPRQRTVLDPQAVWLRHIRLGTSSSPGAREVLGRYYYPDPSGLNDKTGFQAGNYERKINEEGSFQLKFPNGAGTDGILHRDRFAVVSTLETFFRPGDEFIEVWRGKELLFVGAPVSFSLTKTELTIRGYSAFWLLKKTREKSAGYWATAPRDVLEHYLSVWQEVAGADFDSQTFSFSETTQSTSDHWSYLRGEAGSGGALLKSPNESVSGQIGKYGANLISLPYGSSSPTAAHRCWRVEVHFRLLTSTFSSVNLVVGPLSVSCREKSIVMFSETASDVIAGDIKAGEHTIAWEHRDRWDYVWVDGKMAAILPAATGSKTIEETYASVVKGEIECTMFLVQRQRPFLFNSAAKGDLALPGAPTEGGLEGHYHMDQDIWAGGSEGAKLAKVLHPSREEDPASSDQGGLYQRRVDKVIDFPTATPAVWQPPGPPAGEDFSCRWVGSVYLPLSNQDFALRGIADDRVRVWVGKTRLGEEYINDWTYAGHGMVTTTGTWLKAGSSAASPPAGAAGVLPGEASGWFPIVIEYSNSGSGGGCEIEWSRGNEPGTWHGLGTASGESPVLSPVGLHQNIVQYDSHYDAFQAVCDAYGYQWRETPMQLESGLFPGYIEPKARVGRNTEYVLDELESTNVGVEGNADDVADAVLGEAQGLGDPSQNATLTLEVFNLPGNGLFIQEEQESLSDVNVEALVRQRAESLLALRLSTWEEVGAQAQGKRQLVDKFPLAGELSEFKWEPGDGLRLSFPEVNVEDVLPRQIQGMTWNFLPDGLAVPSAAFKQRPRNMTLLLRKMLRGTISLSRNYQGQLVKLSGSIGQKEASTAGSGEYSRCNLPVNLGDIAAATLVVQLKGNTSTMTIEVNGVSTGVTVNTSGRYNILPWLTRDGTSPRFYVRLTGGTGAYEIQSEFLLIRV